MGEVARNLALYKSVYIVDGYFYAALHHSMYKVLIEVI